MYFCLCYCAGVANFKKTNNFFNIPTMIFLLTPNSIIKKFILSLFYFYFPFHSLLSTAGGA